MALFKDKKDLDKVGPIRSARPYFINYVLEHDAIYAHIGQSPQAEYDIKALKIADINGQIYDSQRSRNTQNDHEYWRDRKKKAPHNAYTSITNLTNIAKNLGYPIEKTFKRVLNLSVDEINLEKLSSIDDVQDAIKIRAGYHSQNMNEFKYNETEKVYTKQAKGIDAKEEITGEEYKIKNLIILQTTSTEIRDGENKGRLDIKTVGALKGYYITNGKAKQIIARKATREDITKYYDLEGNEIKLNDGNTYVMIMPEKEKITITGGAQTATEKTEEKMVNNKNETSKKPSTSTTTRRR